MVAIVFMPLTACDDGDPAKKSGIQGISSFAHAVAVLRSQAGREADTGPPEKFERVFVALYEYDDPSRRGNVGFFDVTQAPPRAGRPKKLLNLQQVIETVDRITTERHTDVIEWDVSLDELDAESEDDDDES
jgi:hypothetical protein